MNKVLVILYIIASITSTDSQHIEPIPVCVLSEICNHTWIPVCGKNERTSNIRLFSDFCDMIEYNCDFNTEYKQIDQERCRNDTSSARKSVPKPYDTTVAYQNDGIYGITNSQQKLTTMSTFHLKTPNDLKNTATRPTDFSKQPVILLDYNTRGTGYRRQNTDPPSQLSKNVTAGTKKQCTRHKTSSSCTRSISGRECTRSTATSTTTTSMTTSSTTSITTTTPSTTTVTTTTPSTTASSSVTGGACTCSPATTTSTTTMSSTTTTSSTTTPSTTTTPTTTTTPSTTTTPITTTTPFNGACTCSTPTSTTPTTATTTSITTTISDTTSPSTITTTESTTTATSTTKRKDCGHPGCDIIMTWATTAKGERRDYYQILRNKYGNRPLRRRTVFGRFNAHNSRQYPFPNPKPRRRYRFRPLGPYKQFYGHHFEG